jgi:hypothetical protein
VKKVVGIFTLLSIVSFITLISLVYMQGVMLQASMVKMAYFNLCITVVLCGLHLIETHSSPKKIARMSIWILGVIIIIFSFLVVYDILDYQSNWNRLLAVGIVYITLVELQLLKWEKSKSLLKILGMLVLLSNIFLTVFFLALLKMNSLGVVLDFVVILSVFAFLFGLILSRQGKKQVESSES